MKHVGSMLQLTLFHACYTGVNGGLVVVTADDPGLFSSQANRTTDTMPHAKSQWSNRPTARSAMILKEAFEIRRN